MGQYIVRLIQCFLGSLFPPFSCYSSWIALIDLVAAERTVFHCADAAPNALFYE